MHHMVTIRDFVDSIPAFGDAVFFSGLFGVRARMRLC